MTDSSDPRDDWQALPQQQRERVIDALADSAQRGASEHRQAFNKAADMLRAAALDDGGALQLNQVTLPCTDTARSIAFYTGMGFTLIVDSPTYARFLCPAGSATFSVHQVDRSPDSASVVVYFETAALDEQVAQLKARGYAFIQDPTDQPWLWREARLVDPDGNVLCLFFAGESRINPPWRVGRID